MSPVELPIFTHPAGGPRASGDEPELVEAHNAAVEWSPRERG